MADGAKVGRNERCPCGSGRKYKVCCGAVRPVAAKPAAIPTRHASSPNAAADTVLRQAERFLKAGQFNDAIAPLVKATRLIPDNPALLNDLGMACLFARRFPEAVTWLGRAAALRPDIAGPQHHLGLALAQSGDNKGALAAHLRAIALAPGLAEAHGRVGELLMLEGKKTEAAAAFERAFAASPGTPFGRLCGAKAFAAQGRPSEAEALLRELIAPDAASGATGATLTRRQHDIAWVAHMMLGNLLVEGGRFEEASTHFERSIALAPREATAHHSLVHARRLAEADRALVTRIVSLLDAKGMPDVERMILEFAAGKGLDDLHDYAGAIQHFDAANVLRSRLHAALDRDDVAQRIDRLMARFTRDFFAEHASMGQSDELPVLVLGMPRSGTTLVERILSSHPRVAGGGELDFWNERAPPWVDAPLEKLAEAADGLRADYLKLLRGIGPEALRVTDKMPFNFMWLGLVHLLLPNARIVHCRRNAIDTCLSIYTTNFNRTLEYASNKADLTFYYGQYLRLMEHWRKALPSERFLDVDYEEATASPEETARRLIAFCGLEWDPACTHPEKNPDAVKTASSWQVRQPIYRSSVERWRNYEPWLGELRQLVDLRETVPCDSHGLRPE